MSDKEMISACQLHERGWNAALIHFYFPTPHNIRVGRQGNLARLYYIDQVEAIEKTDEFNKIKNSRAKTYSVPIKEVEEKR